MAKSTLFAKIGWRSDLRGNDVTELEHNQKLFGLAWAERKKHYDDRLGFTGMRASDARDAKKQALARAHEMRKFEIENYWKRSTYFWGFQIVTFGALAFAVKEGNAEPGLTIPVSMLGIVTALAALLSARGSKFWQENWETHVDFLEDDFEGRLHKTAFVRTTLSPSVSRVNERLLEVIIAGWFISFFTALATLICREQCSVSGERCGLSCFATLLKLIYPDLPADVLAMVETYVLVLLALIAIVMACFHIRGEPKSRLEGRAFNIIGLGVRP